MKRLIFSLMCLVCAFSAQAQVQTMEVHLKDGTVGQRFKVDNVDRVEVESAVSNFHQKNGLVETFQVKDIDYVAFEEVVPVRLNNQYMGATAIHNIGSAVREQVEGGYRFALYAATGVTTMAENPLLDIFVADAFIGKTLDLSTMTDAEATLTLAGAPEYTSLMGTLRVGYDKFGNNLIVSLEAETETHQDIRAAYTGGFTTAYSADGTFRVTTIGGDIDEGLVGSFFRMAATEVGGATHFALGIPKTDTPAGFSAGDYALWVSLSPSALYNGTLDLESATGSYTIKLMDYAAGLVVEGAIVGTLTTRSTDDGNVYIAVKATMSDGTMVETEFFGKPSDVESLDGMIPEKKEVNEYVYYNADGKVATQYVVSSVTRTTTGRGLYEFRFVSNEDGSYNCPRLTVAPELVNAGAIDLANLQPNTFQIKYNMFQLYSPDGDYRHIPTNGTMTITRDDAGNYTFHFDALNDYYTTQSGSTSYGGDNTRLVITYKGSVTEN